MSKYRVIDVDCQCGQHLFEYAKGGRGRLIKCYLDQIRVDEPGRGVSGLGDAPLGSRPTCPSCGRALGIVRIVRGRPALKLNQGTIRKVTT